MSELIIIGAGGHGIVAYEIAQNLGFWNNIFFCDDYLNHKDNPLIIGNLNYVLKNDKDFHYFVAIGNNKIRREIIEKLSKLEKEIVSLIHSNAIISPTSSIGIGSIITAGTVIGPKTKIGKGTVINTSASIDHNCNIADYVHVSPGCTIAGNVNIGDNSWICSGTTIINNISICDNCVIGAGSLVLKNINIPGTYYGSPVKKMDRQL